jgi:CO/xanthine dehydrogenase Mo-binding subunit
VKIGFRKDGVIAGIDATFLADVGAYPAQGNGLTLNTVNHLPGPYRWRTTAMSARASSPTRRSTWPIAPPAAPRPSS